MMSGAWVARLQILVLTGHTLCQTLHAVIWFFWEPL